MKQGDIMKRFLLLTLLPLVAFSAGPAPYPVSVNSQSPVVTALQSYQANERTFRVTFKDGTNAVDLTGYTPRMSWATTNTSTNVATSSWAYVASSTSGVVDFTFTPASMNTNGVFIYEVGVAGLPLVYRQGSFTIISSPMGNGAAALTFTNPASYVATVGSQVSGIGFNQATGAAVLTGNVASASGTITGNQHNAILGGLTISNVLQWGTNPASSTAIGASYWSTTYGTKVVNMGFTNLDGTPVMNEEGYNGFVLVQNRSGITISNGAVVAVIPHNASILAVVPAMANGSATNSHSIVGMMTHELVNNAIGVANSFGEVGGLNTAAWIEGTHVYLSTNGNGTLTTNYASEGQTSPFHIGYVSRSHATQGRIWVDIGNHEDDPHWAASSNSISQRITSNQTAIAGKLDSNVWAAAASTTNYVARTGGVYSSPAGSFWTFREGFAGSSISVSNSVIGLAIGGSRIAYITADGLFLEPGMYFSGDGIGITNLDLSPYAGTNITWAGGKLNASVTGGGTDTNSVGLIATNAVNQSTNVAARLASNVWAAADSTTNYVARTGGLYGLNSTATWTFAFGDQSGLFDLQPTRATIILTSSGSGWVQLETNAFSVRGSTVFAGNGSGLTELNGAAITNFSGSGLTTNSFANSSTITWTSTGGVMSAAAAVPSVSLTTNIVWKVPAMRGAWDISSDVPANGGVSLAFEAPFSTSPIQRASMRTTATNQVRTAQGAVMSLSSVATNRASVVVDYVAYSATVTNAIWFTSMGATNALGTTLLTTTGVYRINATNFTGVRDLVPYFQGTQTGGGTTNFGRSFMPVIGEVEQ